MRLIKILVFSLLLLAQNNKLFAQDEDHPGRAYVRPSYKVYKSLSAALQNPDSVYILELKGKKLKEIPEGVFKLPKLVVLDLSRNKIKVLPESISQLSNLIELDLTNNKLKALPSSIGKLTKLRKLALNRNVIEELPAEIGQMKSLEFIELWDNELGTLPEEIKELHNLRSLDLRGILFSEEQHKHFFELLPKTEIYMSPSCNCKTF